VAGCAGGPNEGGYLYIRLLLLAVCTLAFAWQVFDNAPLVVAANRDESNGRPSEPPTLFRDEPRAVAPRDSRAGGSWIGYNEHGVLVAITNRWVDREGDRSRGQLVADCLGYASTTAAVDHVEQSVGCESYAGFNLVIADPNHAVLLEFDGTLSITAFDPGVHVVVNVGADGSYFEPAARPTVGRQQATNADRLRAALEPTIEESAGEWLERAGQILGTHEFGVCVHGEDFGTRSASLILLEEVDGELRDCYLFAEGPPCRTPFRRVESSL